MTDRQVTIGFANLSERSPFAITVRESFEKTVATQYPDVQLVVRDNDFNNEQALANVSEFAAIPVDLAVIYHIDENLGPNLANILLEKSIPIISVDIPIPWSVFYGINNEKAGFLVGEALGQWIQKNWGGQVDKVLAVTEQRANSVVRSRVDSAVTGLISRIPVAKDRVLFMDSESSRATAQRNAKPVLELWAKYEHVAVVCVNDDTALGVLAAAEELGHTSNLAIAGQDANLAIEEFKKPGTRFVASADYHPECYGEEILDLAMRMLRLESVPRVNLNEPECVTVNDFKRRK